jgi:hypothetical protein
MVGASKSHALVYVRFSERSTSDYLPAIYKYITLIYAAGISLARWRMASRYNGCVGLFVRLSLPTMRSSILLE